MPTDRPSSIQKPPFSWRVRSTADSAVSAMRNAGTAIRCDSTTRHGRASWTLATAAKLAARSGRQRWPQAEHGAPPIVGVDHVDRVVSAVGAGDPEEEARPAPEPEATLGRQLPAEDERPPDLVEVDTAPLRNAIHEHVEDVSDLRGQLHVTPRFHALYDATRRAPDRLCHSWYDLDRSRRGGNCLGRERRPAAR